MKDVVSVGNAYVLENSFELVSHEKAIVSMNAGCVWLRLEKHGTTIGFAFAGPSTFVVDAISETREGAWGKSVSGELSGIQIFLGEVDISDESHEVSIDDLRKLDYPDSNTFLDDLKNRLDGFRTRNKQVNISNDGDDRVLIGQTSEEKDVVIVAKDDGLVFTYEGQVFVDGKGNTVSVSRDGVGIHNRDGESLVIDKYGIHGLEGLEELRELGPTIRESVHRGLKELKGIKTAKRHMRSGIRHARRYEGYDDLDDLDWDDDE